MKNWKTGLPGILMLVASILSTVAKVMGGDLPDVQDATGIIGGIGLLAAKDKDVTGGTRHQ